ncbi:MAG TPA: alkaline phosphatase family protein [Candidatus Cybelea sp.]|jgi:phospholipase C
MWKRFAAACVLASCSANGAGSAGIPAALSDAGFAGHSPIKHVIFVIQENRSFNNLFMGYPGATTRRYGYDTSGRRIAMQPVDLEIGWDMQHNAAGFFAACDGTGKLPGTHCKMDGWNNELATIGHPPNPAYSYVPQSETKPYWMIAKQYVLADRTFATNLDGSFVAHQYSVAAYSSRAVNYPVSIWGCEGGSSDTVATLTEHRGAGPNIVACFDNPTIASEADHAGISWRYYTGSIYGDGGLWSAYQADRKIFDSPDWKAKVINPPSQFLADVGAGKLAAITWVAPTYEASDHAALDTGKGPAWIASVVNAVGKSRFWDSSAIFIMWDDWGGWFDPMKPVYADYDGLGFRVPLLAVSPYAKQGYVTHVQYETASVLRFIEDNFGLSHLAASDTRANDPATDAFDYNQRPRKFKEIPGAKTASYWRRIEQASHGGRIPHGILGDD